MRVALAASVTAASEPSAAPSPASSVPVPAGAPSPAISAFPPPKPIPCVAFGDPQIATLELQARARTEAAYTRAMNEAALTPVTVGAKLRRLSSGLDNAPPTVDRVTPVVQGTVTTLDGSRYLAGETYWTLAGHKPRPPELARDKRGALHVVKREAKPIANREVTVCGCSPTICGPYGSGCPGCGETVQVFYGPLPSALADEVIVVYDASFVSVVRAGGACSEGCPAPPPGRPPLENQ